MIRKHPWRDTGVWLMGDTHVHHRQTGLKRVVDEASQYGCDYLAFTEHAHYTEYFQAQPELIEKAHAAHPDMILVNGVEWSTPASRQSGANLRSGRGRARWGACATRRLLVGSGS